MRTAYELIVDAQCCESHYSSWKSLGWFKTETLCMKAMWEKLHWWLPAWQAWGPEYKPQSHQWEKITGCRFAKDQAGPEVCKKLYWEGNKRAASDAFGSLQPLLPTVPCVMLHLAQCSSHRESLFTNCIIGRDDMTVIRHVICTSRDIPISQLNTLRRISSEISIR
jgi:hypothetical protein